MVSERLNSVGKRAAYVRKRRKPDVEPPLNAFRTAAFYVIFSIFRMDFAEIHNAFAATAHFFAISASHFRRNRQLQPPQTDTFLPQIQSENEVFIL